MPWSPDDANRHKKNLGPAAKRKWASIANSVLQESGDEGKAVRIANGSTRQAAQRILERKAAQKRGY